MTMETIGEKIQDIRKRKGLTQEQLSSSAKINLRTLQRIEKNETEPLGNTLNSICNILDINLEDILDYNKTEDKRYLIFFHLSVLSFIIIPIGNIIIPLILWITKRDKIINLNEQGADLLNFQILWSFLFYASVIAFPVLNITHRIERWIPLVIAITLFFLNVVYTVITIILIKQRGVKKYYFPLIKFIKT
jgi:transcriptional regulator with XRE-family HTH domain